VAAIPLGGTAAAYTGVLPGPVQDFAHHVIHAPPAHRPGHPRQHPAGDTPGHGNAVAPTASQPASPEPVMPKGTPKPAKPAKPQPTAPKQKAPKPTAPATVTPKVQLSPEPTTPATAIPKHERKRYKDKTRHSGLTATPIVQ
jgi:hypothetical protein